MPLTLMYITKNPEIAAIAQKAGVDRIFLDMEYIGKDIRQGGMDTVKNHHTVEDIVAIRRIASTSEILVRVNPLHAVNATCGDSKKEIDEAIAAGADVLMLPMFQTPNEAATFIEMVDGRAKVQLLVETAEAVKNIDGILRLQGIDEIHIGLNDLHLAYHKSFMFELLCDGTVETLCHKASDSGVKYGFGGIARVGYGMLPAEYVIAEHYRLGSTAAILSRSFCNANLVQDPLEIEDAFIQGVRDIRTKEQEVALYSEVQYAENLKIIREKVAEIIAIRANES